jgi:hypothetical protein
MELLKEFMEAMPRARVHVVRNGYFGDERKFELYNSSKLRTTVEGQGGKSVTLPDLADRVADDIYTQRLSLWCGIQGFADRKPGGAPSVARRSGQSTHSAGSSGARWGAWQGGR